MDPVLLDKSLFESRFSFRPLIDKWKLKMEEGRKGASLFYKDILQKVSQYPELLQPIDDLSVLQKHPALLELMMATVFPVTSSDHRDLYAVSVPLRYDFVYSSSYFKKAFLDEQGKIKLVLDPNVAANITHDKTAGAYAMILRKFYNLDIADRVTTVHPFHDPFTGLKRYLEFRVDPQFVDVHAKMPLPEHNFGDGIHYMRDILKIPRLQELLPLSMFEFEGLAIIYITDVTEREVITEIKNDLLNIHSFSDSTLFQKLQLQMQNLLGLPDVTIGLTPFFRVNEHYVFAEQYYQNSILLEFNKTPEGQNYLCNEFKYLFKDGDKQYILIPTLTREIAEQYPFLQCVVNKGAKSVVIAPLLSNNELIGVLVLMSEKAGYLSQTHITKIEPALPLFQLALEKIAEGLDTEIDKVIKQQFTAVQSSVEWKFTEAALNYITKKQRGEEPKIEHIVFDNVYPLYGAIDIRNSSTERNLAIQQDLLEQLIAAQTIVQKAQEHVSFPLLQEINYRIEKHIYTVSNVLFSGDEIIIHNFLKEEIVQLFRHLKQVVPAVSHDIENYFGSLDKHIDMLYYHRKEFEDSITLINNHLAKFIDKEQAAAQQIFPHYFERFVTDGVDFNIYIGQSITPSRPFDQFYLKNLKMWQLTTLAKAAQMTHVLEKQLMLPLYTTQLILAHSNPISISFRSDERKFDVDGAYNIRYEIIKKRIDKVRIKDTNERLTQPGKIAVVYSQPKEAAEYSEYIEFLLNQGLLSGEVEHFDLEELQGVSGLKALRVGISFKDADTQEKKVQQQKISNE